MSTPEPGSLSNARETAILLASAALRRGLGSQEAIRLARRIASLADRAIAQVSEEGSLACAPGCTACCHQLVFATAPEALAVFEVLQADPILDRDELVQALEAYGDAVGSERPEGFLRNRTPCPLLKDRRCLVYEARPLFCRGLTSNSKERCDVFREDPQCPPSESPNGQSEIAAAVSEGLMTALEQPALELWHVLLRMLRGEAPEGLLGAPQTFLLPSDRPWRVRLAPPASDPLAHANLTKEHLERGGSRGSGRDREDFAARLPSDAAYALARLELPSSYEAPEEVLAWRARFEQALEDAWDLKNWDAAVAYLASAHLQPIGLGYQPGNLRKPMARLGSLLVERIARPLAPQLCEDLPFRRPGRARVGMIANFGANSASRWALGWLQSFDPTLVETFALKVCGREDATSFAFKDRAEHYYRLAGHPLAMAEWIRSLDLDYLIYPELGDTHSLYQYAMFRLARRQAAAWGCPFTSGLPTIDEYLSSELMEPEDGNAAYTEALLRLPGCGLTLARRGPTPRAVSRGEFGLPSGFLAVFPQYVVKWLPGWDGLMSEVAARTGNPIVLIDVSARDREVFDRRLDRVGVPRIWLSRMPNDRFRRLLACCDVVLDSPEWSGGLTTTQALDAGTPVVNLQTPYLRGRLASGFCAQALAPDLIAHDAQDYVDLATSPARLKEAMARLDASRIYGDERPGLALLQHILEGL